MNSLKSSIPGRRLPLRRTAQNAVNAAIVQTPVDEVSVALATVNAPIEVEVLGRKLTNKAEFYGALTDFVSSDITSELRFENLKANLHVYDNDRDTFFGDRDNLTVALYRGYNRMTMFGKKSMRECEVLSLYDAQQALKSKDQLTNYKALGKLRSPLMDKVRKRFTDYLNRLFPALVGVDISVVASVVESSETTSSVVPSSVRITGGLANININVDCNNDDAVNDEYDSDDDDVPAENVADDVSNDDNDDSVDEDDMDGEVEEENDDNDDSVDEDDKDGGEKSSLSLDKAVK